MSLRCQKFFFFTATLIEKTPTNTIYNNSNVNLCKNSIFPIQFLLKSKSLNMSPVMTVSCEFENSYVCGYSIKSDSEFYVFKLENGRSPKYHFGPIMDNTFYSPLKGSYFKI